MKKPIYVTQPYLPPLEQFIPYLEQIWKSKQITNNGPLHQQLEQELCNYLGVPQISLFCNGTIALLTALQALGIEGEVITTPYSFVATSHALLWNQLTPVFVDIDPITLNIDPTKIEAAITDKTTAILAVHCYGTPCDVDAIQAIANKHGLKVIYDAAHAFGVEDAGGSILRHGDLSILSFHATKVFNTFEGGAIISPDAETKAYIDQLKNFGFTGETSVVTSGINGKMSEVNAAMGLLQLKYIDEVIAERQKVDQYYRDYLVGVKGITCVPNTMQTRANYSYFPILVEDDYLLNRDELYEKLKENNIFSRRYFYPLISDFDMYKDYVLMENRDLINSSCIAEKVLCLPIYSGVDAEKIIHNL